MKKKEQMEILNDTLIEKSHIGSQIHQAINDVNDNLEKSPITGLHSLRYINAGSCIYRELKTETRSVIVSLFARIHYKTCEESGSTRTVVNVSLAKDFDMTELKKEQMRQLLSMIDSGEVTKDLIERMIEINE